MGRPDRLAEGEGFEPPVPCGTPVFKTGAFVHSATPPVEFGSTGADKSLQNNQCNENIKWIGLLHCFGFSWDVL